MIFSSLVFIFYFLPAVLTLYYLVREDMRNYVLLAASFVFYAWGEPQYCILMFAIVVVNYFAALLIGLGGIWSKLFFALALLADFGALCFCKYMDFLIGNFNALFHGHLDLLHIALPIGISFYIFQSVSYVFDVYRKETAPQRDFFKLLLFISFFPQMIAGPILKYHDMEQQLNRRTVSMPLFAYGVKRFIAGLAKKILIADTLSVVADRLLENGGSYFPGWCDEGWWRTDDWSWQTWKSFGFRNHVSWRAQIPKNHELELVLRPKPGTKGRHVLVVVRRVYEETRHLPLNGIPFVTFIWEKDRTGVYLENDYYKLEKIDPDRAVWKPAKGEERKIRLVLNDWRVEVFVDDGDEPVVSTQKYAMTIERSPEIGYASFVGDNVKISNIAVRKPQLHTGGK